VPLDELGVVDGRLYHDGVKSVSEIIQPDIWLSDSTSKKVMIVENHREGHGKGHYGLRFPHAFEQS
jgi:hypothetical protein